MLPVAMAWSFSGGSAIRYLVCTIGFVDNVMFSHSWSEWARIKDDACVSYSSPVKCQTILFGRVWEAGGHRRRPNLALFFVLILSYSIFRYGCMFAFVVCFRFLVLSQEIGWEEHLQSDLFYVGWDIKPELNQSYKVRN